MKTKKQIEDRLLNQESGADDCENPNQKQIQAIVNALCWVLDKPDEYEDVSTPRFVHEK